MASLAELLDYQARKKQVLDALNNASTGIENVSYGLGEGFADQVRGIGQLVQHPIQSVQDVYQGVKQAVQNPRQALEGVKQYAQEAVSSPTAFAKAVGQNVNPMELVNALKKAGAMRELTVYHGTPHRLPPTEANPLGEFDASKIGTGEGAQAYGHGIYVAQNPAIAKSYQIDLSNYEQPYVQFGKTKKAGQELDDIDLEALKYLERGKNNAGEFPHNTLYYAKLAAKEKPEVLERLDQYGRDVKFGYEKNKGNFYTIDLPDEMIDKMLDWDKPLSQQHLDVQKAISKFGPIPEKNEYGEVIKGDALHKILLGRASGVMYGPVLKEAGIPDTARGGTSERLSAYLASQGVPGIKYLDQQSRRFNQGTRNFVVFPGEEKKAKIIKRE